MKKTKIMVGSILYDIDPTVYATHLDLFYKLGTHKADNIDLIFYGPWRTPIDKGRNDVAHLALYHECDYVFFFDDDMYFHDADVPFKLLKRCIDNPDIHIIQALAFIRGYPFKPMLFKWTETKMGKGVIGFTDYKDHIDENGLVKCAAVGCPATLISTELFRKVPAPWFETGEMHTEDIYFCVKSQQYLENVGIYCDTTLPVGHLLEKPILTSTNAEWLKDMYDNQRINQLFLPDITFKTSVELASKEAIFEKRDNPIEMKEAIVYRKEKENG